MTARQGTSGSFAHAGDSNPNRALEIQNSYMGLHNEQNRIGVKEI